MQSIFTTWAETNLPSDTTPGNFDLDYDTNGNIPLDLTVFVRSPNFLDIDQSLPDFEAHIKSISTLTELLATPGWQEAVGGGAGETMSVPITSIGSAGNISYADYSVTPFQISQKVDPIFATAFALSMDDNLICVFRPDTPVFLPGDENISTIECSSVAGVNGGIGYWFAWQDTDTENNSSEPAIGPISIAIPTANWEPARASHVWMAPQRVNLVVNPSFEVSQVPGHEDIGSEPETKTGGIGFRYNTGTTGTRVLGGMGRNPREYCLQLEGGDTKVVESSLFPTKFGNEWWSVEAGVCGSGTVSLGIVFWDATMDPDQSILVESGPIPFNSADTSGSFDPTAENFITVKALLKSPDAFHEGMFRLTFKGSTEDVYIDDLLVDPNEAQLGYFDGDWSYGQNGDFDWYGGGSLSGHSTFSVFYNNRKNLTKQLFGHYEIDKYGDEVYIKGIAEEWVPEGVTVIPHWDDIYAVQTPTWFQDVYIPTAVVDASTPVGDFHLRLTGTATGSGTASGTPTT